MQKRVICKRWWATLDDFDSRWAVYHTNISVASIQCFCIAKFLWWYKREYLGVPFLYSNIYSNFMISLPSIILCTCTKIMPEYCQECCSWVFLWNLIPENKLFKKCFFITLKIHNKIAFCQQEYEIPYRLYMTTITMAMVITTISAAPHPTPMYTYIFGTPARQHKSAWITFMSTDATYILLLILLTFV